jgi:hypothetical protein
VHRFMNMLLSLALITTCALAQSTEQSTGTVQDVHVPRRLLFSPKSAILFHQPMRWSQRCWNSMPYGILSWLGTAEFGAMSLPISNGALKYSSASSGDSNGAKQFTIVSEQGSERAVSTSFISC